MNNKLLDDIEAIVSADASFKVYSKVLDKINLIRAEPTAEQLRDAYWKI